MQYIYGPIGRRHLLRTAGYNELITEVTKASAAEREIIAVQNKRKRSLKV